MEILYFSKHSQKYIHACNTVYIFNLKGALILLASRITNSAVYVWKKPVVFGRLEPLFSQVTEAKL
jgi:hypothetical protein